MKKFIILTALWIVASSAMNSTSFANDCNSLRDDSINDAVVSNLQQAAANAEQRAAMARNPNERQRWEDQAQAFQMQAQAAQARSQSMGNAAANLCDALTDQQ